MKKSKILFISITAIILLLLTAGISFAQGQVITANVDRTALTTDDTLTLTITVSVDQITTPTPTLPHIPGFTIVGNSSSSQISMINGAMSSQVIYTVHLQPFESGTLVIDPVTVAIDGQTFDTQPITVEVSQGNGSPSAPAQTQSATANPTAPVSSDFNGQKIFTEAEVSNATPFIGEQVIYTFRLYQSPDMFDGFSQPQYEPPSFTGFWVENTEQDQYRIEAFDRYYDVVELRTTLFPSVMGPVAIDPAHLVIPGGFFNRGGQVQTQPVSLTVNPLPAGAPSTFNGAVGQFTLDAVVDTNQSKVNEPITWKVALNGWGNLKAMADPQWPDIANWRSFESQATTNSQFQDGRVVGNKTYERLLVPEAEGQFVIPALEYSYFDPTTQTYQTISAPAIPVSIAPGDAMTTAQVASVAPLPDVNKETVAQMATDIRHLKSAQSQLKIGNNAITNSPLYWLAWGVPLMGLVGNFVWQRKHNYKKNNVGAVRASQAYKKARKTLAQIKRQKPDDVYSAAGQVLADYLSDKLNYPVAGLTHQALADRLTQMGLTTQLIDRVNVCWADTELGRFSPEAENPAHADALLKEVEVLVKDLEKVL